MDHHASDEAFWRRQERRRERGLGQPCCTQSGMSWTLIDMPGNFAVVIHGEFDCVNCFTHHSGRSATQYYSTRLTDRQLTLGETADPLRRCLQLELIHLVGRERLELAVPARTQSGRREKACEGGRRRSRCHLAAERMLMVATLDGGA